MPDSFTSDKVAALQMATGENENTWGSRLNDEALGPLANAISGRLAKSVAGASDVTLTASEATNAIQEYTGALTGSINVIVPTATGFYLVYNNTSGAFSLTVKTSAGTGVTVSQGKKRLVYCDGTNVVDALTEFPALTDADINGGEIDGTPIGANSPSTGSFTTLTASGATTLNGNVYIDDQGRLGVGVSSPVNGFDLATGLTGTYSRFRIAPSAQSGGAAFGARLVAAGGHSSPVACASIDMPVTDGTVGSEDAQIIFATIQNGTLTESVVLDENGRVGIGTLTPDTPLHLHGGSAGTFTGGVSGRCQMLIEDDGQAGLQIACPDAQQGNIIFGAPSDEDFAELRAQYNGGSPYLLAAISASEVTRWNGVGFGVNRAAANGYKLDVQAASGAEGDPIARFSDSTPTPMVEVFAGNSGTAANAANAVLKVKLANTTSRSINMAGTANASGADYAEYMTKADGCGVIAKGDVCGVDAAGRLTDKWADAVSFRVKSTNPSYVGGDVWSPERAEDESDEAFAERYEAARQTVDRIAYSGRVPVNIAGEWSVGDYIVAVQDGDRISCEAQSAPDFATYRDNCVGRIEGDYGDGRPMISVKVA